MSKKKENYRKNSMWVFLTVSLFILPLTIGAEQMVPKTGREKLKTKVTLTCVDKKIGEVLMELADKANIDIVKAPDVNGLVTAKVTDIPLEEALTNILAVYKWTYIATENMIRVMKLPPQTELKEQQVTRIYKIAYADANIVFGALKEFVTGKAEVGFNKSTNHIIVTDKEEKIKAIDEFIEQIDHVTPQVLVEVRIYDVTTKEGFELSPQWHIGRNAPYTGDTILIPDQVQTLEISPESETFREETRETKKTPVWPPGTFDEVWEQLQESWTTQSGKTETERTYEQPGFITTNRRRKPFVGGTFDRVTGGTLSFSVLNDAVDLDLALTILHSQVGARLLANPRILVVDNEPAKFEIVREFPYRELLQVTREDPMSYTDFKKVGVDLKVTPHITRDGMLRLKIEPEFSVLVSREAISVLRGTDDLGRMTYQSVLGVPVIDSRRLETTAMIKDGQTITVGGLRKREVTRDVAKVPVLGDLPLVGGLFNSESESVAINELIVFITATIVAEPTLSESEKKLFDETAFTTPDIEKTRIEKGELEKTEVEKVEDGKAKDEKADITETLDLLLEKLGPSDED
jgi:type II secretory pathway component GspD/PulD (secretin)